MKLSMLEEGVSIASTKLTWRRKEKEDERK